MTEKEESTDSLSKLDSNELYEDPSMPNQTPNTSNIIRNEAELQLHGRDESITSTKDQSDKKCSEILPYNKNITPKVNCDNKFKHGISTIEEDVSTGLSATVIETTDLEIPCNNDVYEYIGNKKDLTIQPTELTEMVMETGGVDILSNDDPCQNVDNIEDLSIKPTELTKRKRKANISSNSSQDEEQKNVHKLDLYVGINPNKSPIMGNTENVVQTGKLAVPSNVDIYENVHNKEEDLSIKPTDLTKRIRNVSPEAFKDEEHHNFHNLDLYVRTDPIECPIIENTKSAMVTTDVEELNNDDIHENIDDNDEVEKYNIYHNSLIELGRRLWPSTPNEQHYTKGCLWSPDGTCLLVPVHMDGMHIVDLPSDLYNIDQISKDSPKRQMLTAVHVEEGGTVYDYTWYPFMTSSDPDTCCWIASRQHEPIHMWDAYTGQLRCTYRGYDAVDEVEAAISLRFNSTGEKIFGGYKKSIKIFDTAIPGRDYINIPVKQTVACMAVTKDNDRYVTTGSWNSFIYHYDLRAIKLGPLFALSGHSGGVTWLQYMEDETSEWHLFSGARKDNKILQWDMRNYKEPYKIYERNVSTNQRIYFDLDPFYSKWLISGDTQGYLRAWNLENSEEYLQIRLHNDCCNGANFHPTLPILATTSGQYHFIETSIQEDQDMKQKLNDDILTKQFLDQDIKQQSNENISTENSEDQDVKQQLNDDVSIKNFENEDLKQQANDNTSIKKFEYENCLLLTWFGISY